MKKTKLFSAISMLILFIVILTSCGNSNKTATNDQQLNARSEALAHSEMGYTMAFFPDQSDTLLIPLSYPISKTRDVVWVAVEKLLAGTPNDFTKDAIPEGFKLDDLYIQNDVAYIKLIGEENVSTENINLAAFAATVNFALNGYSFNFDDAYPINLYINDKQITDGIYTLTNPNRFIRTDESTEAIIFYSDTQAMFMVPAFVELDNSEAKDNYYLALLNKWTSAAPSENLACGAPKDTKVLSATLKGNNLIVDLSKAAISYGGGTTQEQMFLNSLLWTLSPYQEITTVKIIIDGQPIAALPEGTSIKTPIMVPHTYENLNIINTVNK